MAMTKRERRAIEAALIDLQRVQRMIAAPDFVFCRPSRGFTTIEYANRQGEYLTKMCKDIGSELCLLPSAIKRIAAVLAPPSSTGEVNDVT